MGNLKQYYIVVHALCNNNINLHAWLNEVIEIITPALRKKDIFIIFTMNAFFPSFNEMFSLSYNKYIYYFSNYINFSIGQEDLCPNNIFFLVNKELQSQQNYSPKLIAEFMQKYREMNPNLALSPTEPICNSLAISNLISYFMTQYKKECLNTVIRYVILPDLTPYEYVIKKENIDDEFEIIYLELNYLKAMYLIFYIKKYFLVK